MGYKRKKTYSGGVAPCVEKYRQMVFAFLRNNPSRGGKVQKTKLAKLLYLADFGWYYEHLKSMSGMQYRKIEYGPVPNAYFQTINGLCKEGSITVVEKETAQGNRAELICQTEKGERQSTDMLSRKEKDFIKQIAEKWRNKNVKTIVAFTHNQIPYKICKDKENIPYELIIQEDPGHVY